MRGRTSALQGVLLLTTTGMLSQIIGFVYRIFLSQRIGAETLGLYQLLMPTYSVLLSLCAVGLCAAMAYLSARYQALGNPKAIWQLRGRCLRLFFLLALLPVGLLLRYSDGISVSILGDARTQLGLLLLIPCLLLTGIENLHKHYFYGVGNVRPPALTELLEQVLRSVAVLGLLAVFLPCTAEQTVGWIVVGMILCEIFSAVVQSYLFRRALGSPLRLQGAGSETLYKEMRQMAIPVSFTAILGNVLGSANAILLPRLLVQGGMDLSEAMSRFGVLFGMTLPMLSLPTAFLGALSLVLTPKLSEALALGREDDISRSIAKALSASNLILFPALALLASVGGHLGEILYKDPRVGDYMPWLALGLLCHCWESLLLQSLNGLNHAKTAAKISLLADAVQLVLCIFLMGQTHLGLAGFVWSYGVGGALGALCAWYAIGREVPLRLPWISAWLAPALAACLCASCAGLLETLLLREGLSLLGASVCALGFGVILYLAGLQAQGIFPLQNQN